MTLATTLAALSIFSISSHPYHPKPTDSAFEAAPVGPAVTVMTFNVNFGLPGDHDTLEAIGKPGADVVMLEETNDAWEDAIRARWGATYPYMRFEPGRGAGGIGVISKLPITTEERLPEVTWFPAMRVVVDGPAGPLQLLGVHLRPGFSDSGSVVKGWFVTPKIRERETAAFTAALDDTLPTIVLGDFNEDRGRAVKLLERQGFADVLPTFEPHAKTWRWNVKVIGQIHGRFDHLMTKNGPVATDAKVLPLGNSDHLPVIGTFVLPEVER